MTRADKVLSLAQLLAALITSRQKAKRKKKKAKARKKKAKGYIQASPPYYFGDSSRARKKK